MADDQLRTTTDATRPFALKSGFNHRHVFSTGQKNDAGQEILEYRNVAPGEVVHLTDVQARAWSDRFEPADAAAQRAADPVATLEAENRELRRQLAAAKTVVSATRG